LNDGPMILLPTAWQAMQFFDFANSALAKAGVEAKTDKAAAASIMRFIAISM
jgi:hypothetical protein